MLGKLKMTGGGGHDRQPAVGRTGGRAVDGLSGVVLIAGVHRQWPLAGFFQCQTAAVHV